MTAAIDTQTIYQLWLKALERGEGDPQGAITLARTLLESVCKHILDENGLAYDTASDLPGLYRMTAKALNIAPSKHLEPIINQVLNGCTAIVEGLGALRNRLSDATAKAKSQ